MVERAFIEKAATAGNVTADDFVNTAKRAAPLGFVGAEENECRGSDKSCEMREGSVICNEGPAGGEEIEEFITLDVEDAPRDTQVVLTKIVVPSEDDVQLNYRMIERDGSWKVIDVFLNGTVSELALRRSEYSAALKSSGFDQLVASVETKIEDLNSKGQADGKAVTALLNAKKN